MEQARPNFYEIIGEANGIVVADVLGVPAICKKEDEDQSYMSYNVKFINPLINKGLNANVLEEAVSRLVKTVWGIDLRDKENNSVIISHTLGTANQNRAKSRHQLTQEIREEKNLMGRFRSTGAVLSGDKQDLNQLVFCDFLYGF